MRYLFINIKIQEGEHQHNHKVLLQTKCNNLDFAAQYYIAHYWGYGQLQDKWWWWDGVHAEKLDHWKEVSLSEYEILNKYI